HSHDIRDLHSFPTRRSSDLGGGMGRIGPDLPERLPILRRQAIEPHGSSRVASAVGHGRRGGSAFIVEAVADMVQMPGVQVDAAVDRKSTRLNSSHVKISYAV